MIGILPTPMFGYQSGTKLPRRPPPLVGRGWGVGGRVVVTGAVFPCTRGPPTEHGSGKNSDHVIGNIYMEIRLCLYTSPSSGPSSVTLGGPSSVTLGVPSSVTLGGPSSVTP